jgi:leucyl aminopeptidase
VSHAARIRLAKDHHGESQLNTVTFLTDDNTELLPPHLKPDFDAAQLVVQQGFTASTKRVFVPLGPKAKVNVDKLRAGVAKSINYFRNCKTGGTVQFMVPHNLVPNIADDVVAHTIAQSSLLTNYSYDKYQTKPAHQNIDEIVLAGAIESFAEPLKDIKALCDATIFARDLSNERGDVATPDEFELLALEFASKMKLNVNVIKGEELVSKGLNLLHSVGRASRYLPRLITIEHWGDPARRDQVVVVVGKGITFDTGGLNLKPTGSMETMHLDKSGAAVALAASVAASRLNIPKNIVFVLALAENAIGSGSYKPHAIIKSHKGITVEVGNTDAEGRLALADAMSFVQDKYKPQVMVDFATLTGACVVALGEDMAGLFSNDDALAQKLTLIGDKVHERVWRMPLLQEHKAMLKNSFADTSSTGTGRNAGASTAAAFLQKFVRSEVKWAHIDIAGPAAMSKRHSHFPQGGTGFGVQLITQYLRSLGSA